jgi:hypothetical protein
MIRRIFWIFYHNNGKSSGQIDYIISTCKNILKKVEIMDMDPKNTSDHVPVIAQIKRKLVRRAYKPKTTIVISIFLYYFGQL